MVSRLETSAASWTRASKMLALLHGLGDVRIWMAAQLNLGALNGIEAARVSGARDWIATHDENRRGGGLISWLLQRITYSLKDAVASERRKLDTDGLEPYTDAFAYVELDSGNGLVLE